MSDWPFERVAIIGPGLIGGSLGLAMKAAGYTGLLVGCARRRQTVETALAGRCIDRGTTDLAEACEKADLVVLCTPVGSMPDMLEQVGRLNEQAVITDAGSTKRQVVEAAGRVLRRPERFVGAHPMAGAEQSGPQAARADLFAGKPCILTPTGQTDPQALDLVRQLWQRLGMRVMTMGPAEHDQATALFSHLPHLLAVALVLSAADRSGWEVASTGFAGASRLASSNPPMRADIIQSNRDALLEALDRVRQRLDQIYRHVEQADRAGLLELLERARQVRERWVQSVRLP